MIPLRRMEGHLKEGKRPTCISRCDWNDRGEQQRFQIIAAPPASCSRQQIQLVTVDTQR